MAAFPDTFRYSFFPVWLKQSHLRQNLQVRACNSSAEIPLFASPVSRACLIVELDGLHSHVRQVSDLELDSLAPSVRQG